MAVARALLFFAVVAALSGQSASDEVRQTYAKLCSGCHGADARGSQQGPGLAGHLRLRRRSAQSLRNVIVRGIPAAGMPGFDLPEATTGLNFHCFAASIAAAINMGCPETPVAEITVPVSSINTSTLITPVMLIPSHGSG